MRTTHGAPDDDQKWQFVSLQSRELLLSQLPQSTLSPFTNGWGGQGFGRCLVGVGWEPRPAVDGHKPWHLSCSGGAPARPPVQPGLHALTQASRSPVTVALWCFLSGRGLPPNECLMQTLLLRPAPGERSISAGVLGALKCPIPSSQSVYSLSSYKRRCAPVYGLNVQFPVFVGTSGPCPRLYFKTLIASGFSTSPESHL